MRAELINEDQPKRISRFLEAFCGVNEKPASMRASPVPGFMHLASGAPKAGPRLPKRDRLHQSARSDQDWRQKPPRSLAGGLLMLDFLFGVVWSVGEEIAPYGSHGLPGRGNGHRPIRRRSDVTTAGVPPGICASSAEIARLDRMHRHGNALQASARLRRSTSSRTWRRIPATCRATN